MPTGPTASQNISVSGEQLSNVQIGEQAEGELNISQCDRKSL